MRKILTHAGHSIEITLDFEYHDDRYVRAEMRGTSFGYVAGVNVEKANFFKGLKKLEKDLKEYIEAMQTSKEDLQTLAINLGYE